MRTTLLGGCTLLAIVALLAGCGKTRTGNAVLLFHWPSAPSTARASQFAGAMGLLQGTNPLPTTDPTSLSRIQSLRLVAYRERRIVADTVFNRPQGALTCYEINMIPVGRYRLVATAFADQGGIGFELGQAVASVKVTADTTTTVEFTTVAAPDARLMIWPESPELITGQTVDLHGLIYNPDGAIVLLPNNALVWKSEDTYIAEISPVTGRTTGRHRGSTRITVADRVTGLTGSTKLTVRDVPPTVSLTANRSRVHPGDAVRLSWSSRNATYVISNFRAFDLSGETIVHPTETTTYEITACGPGGSATERVLIEVR